MPGKTARALCPVCQEPMPPDETECDNCGAFVIDEAVVRLSRAFGIPREKALALFEKGFRHPKQIGNRNVDEVLQRGENGLLYLCTNCGGFVATGDQKCPRCGAEFEAEEPEEVPTEKDILDLVLCPVCGADNSPSWKECEICGEPLGGTEEPPSSGAAVTAPAAKEATPAEGAAKGTADPGSDLPTIDRIDDILKDLEAPASVQEAPAVRRVAKVPKVPRPRPPAPLRPRPRRRAKVARPEPRAIPRPPAHAPGSQGPARARPAERPRPRLASLPVRPAGVAEKPPARRRTPLPAARRPRRRSAPPSEFTAGIVLAAGAGLYVSASLDEALVAWGVVGVLCLLIPVLLGTTVARRESGARRLDGALLAAAAAVGCLAPALPAAAAPLASVGCAVLLAFATRRLLGSTVRDLLTVTSALPLAVLGGVAAEGLPFAATPAWIFGLAAALPWPAAVVVQGLRARSAAAAARQEITKAERDLARRDYAESVRDFDRAIALGVKGSPGAELPWYGKGASLILLGRYDEA